MKKQVRIRGIVRLLTHVRSCIDAGLTEHERPKLMGQVQAALRETEAICQRAGTDPSSLPPPSRRAYRFLKGIDWERLSTVDAGDRKPAACSISGVVATLKWLQAHMCDLAMKPPDPRTLAEFKDHLRGEVDHVEDLCRLAGSTPHMMPRPSRRSYGLMRFLLAEDNLAAHVDTVRRLTKLAQAGPAPAAQRLTVELGATTHLWRVVRHRGARRLCVTEGLLAAPDHVLSAVVHAALVGPAPETDAALSAFQHTDAYAELMLDLHAFVEAEPVRQVGCAHDLRAVIEAVNARYFHPPLQPATFSWSDSVSARTFGHYVFATDAVLISASLDQPQVPRYAVDFVMFHELLHKKHGVSTRGRRRAMHTAAFRRDERRFHDYDRATAFLTDYSRRLGARH